MRKEKMCCHMAIPCVCYGRTRCTKVKKRILTKSKENRCSKRKTGSEIKIMCMTSLLKQ